MTPADRPPASGEPHEHEYENKIGGYPDEPDDLAEWHCDCGAVQPTLAEIAARPPASGEPHTDPLWDELLMDALASDGPIRDRDVKDAIARWRPKIEATHESIRESLLDRIERAIQEQMDDPITLSNSPEATRIYQNALGVVRTVRREAANDY